MQASSGIFHVPKQEGPASEFLAIHGKNLDAMISEAHTLFQGYRMHQPDAVLWTPLLRSHWLSDGSVNVFVKLETEQFTNSFKVRGALNRTHLAARHGKRAVVTASTGNHALAILHAVKFNDIGCTIFLPKNATSGKIRTLRDRAKGTTAKIEFAGDDCLQAELAAEKYSHENSLLYISPYNDLRIMAGQGTIGVEILETLSILEPSRDNTIRRKCCYVTVGGGGLIAGIAACLKYREPGVWRVVGCLPHNSPVMYDSVVAGKVVESKCLATLSDGSGGEIEDDSITLGYCQNLVDAWALITEEDIASAIASMFNNHRKVLEGAAAVAVAGFQKDAKWRDENSATTAVIVACGGNIDADVFAGIVKQRR